MRVLFYGIDAEPKFAYDIVAENDTALRTAVVKWLYGGSGELDSDQEEEVSDIIQHILEKETFNGEECWCHLAKDEVAAFAFFLKKATDIFKDMQFEEDERAKLYKRYEALKIRYNTLITSANLLKEGKLER